MDPCRFQGRMLRAEFEHRILHPFVGSEARRWAGAGQGHLLEGSADVGRHLKSEADGREQKERWWTEGRACALHACGLSLTRAVPFVAPHLHGDLPQPMFVKRV